MADTDKSGFTITETELSAVEFDNQLFAIGGFALVALILIIFVFYVGVGNFTQINTRFQLLVDTQISAIQALLPPTLRASNKILNTLVSLGTNTYDVITTTIVQGSQAVLNVILAVGGTLIETITTFTKTLLEQLQAIGSTVQTFFENVFDPIVLFAQHSGDTIILFIALIAGILSPMLSFIGAIFRAIQRIGHVF